MALKREIDDLKGELKDASTPEDKRLLIRQLITANTNRLTGLETRLPGLRSDLRKLGKEGEPFFAGCSCSCPYVILYCSFFPHSAIYVAAC